MSHPGWWNTRIRPVYPLEVQKATRAADWILPLWKGLGMYAAVSVLFFFVAPTQGQHSSGPLMSTLSQNFLTGQWLLKSKFLTSTAHLPCWMSSMQSRHSFIRPKRPLCRGSFRLCHRQQTSLWASSSLLRFFTSVGNCSRRAAALLAMMLEKSSFISHVPADVPYQIVGELVGLSKGSEGKALRLMLLP